MSSCDGCWCGAGDGIGHFAQRSAESENHGARHDGVPDVEIHEARESCDRAHVVCSEAVSGVEYEARFAGGTGGGFEALEFTPRSVAAEGVGPLAGVQLDARGAERATQLHIAWFGCDEKAHTRSDGLQPLGHFAQTLAMAVQIEAAFRGELLTPLRHQRRLRRAQTDRVSHDVLGRAHFVVEGQAYCGHHALDVAVLHMTTVFTEVESDSVHMPRPLREQCRFENVGVGDTTHLPQRGHVIEVDIQSRSHEGRTILCRGTSKLPSDREAAMRVIAGELRGRTLNAPAGERTRPIMDRQKETLFNILMAEFPCAGVLDIFAGSGGLGIEALSRGAEAATFIESGRHALPVLEQNLVALGVRERASVLALPAERFDPERLTHAVHLAFLDPPFPLVLAHPQRMAELLARLLPVLDEGGVLVLRVPVNADLAACTPADCRPFRTVASGESMFHLFASTRALSGGPGSG